MSRHEHFEELCSLAVLGEVSPEELTELEKHLRECPECRIAYADFVALAGEHLPDADRSSVRLVGKPTVEVTAGLRQATFAKVANEGFHISHEAMAEQFTAAPGQLNGSAMLVGRCGRGCRK